MQISSASSPVEIDKRKIDQGANYSLGTHPVVVSSPEVHVSVQVNVLAD